MVVELLITESEVKELHLVCLAKSLWLLSCLSQRVQVKELQLVCLAKSLWLLSCLLQRVQ